MSHIAYIVTRFPKTTETFIADEICEMRRQGARITIVSLLSRQTSVPHANTQQMKHDVVNPGALDWNNYRRGLFSLLGAGQAQSRRVISTCLRNGISSPRWAIKTLLILARSLAFADYLARNQENIDHVHAGFAGYAATSALVVSRRLNTAYTVASHANDIYRPNPLLQHVMDQATAVTTISEYNTAHLGTLGSEKRSCGVEVIRAGIEANVFTFRTARPKNSVPRLVSVGSLVDKKGHEDLLLALAQLKSRDVFVRLTLIGEGPLLDRLLYLTAEHELFDRVSFAGAQSSDFVRSQLAQADVFVLACRQAADGMIDGIPVALMEAMATGVPVVTTRVSGVPELVEDRVTGYLAAPGCPDSLALAIEHAICDPAQSAVVVAAARRRIETQYSLSANTKRKLEVIRDATRLPEPAEVRMPVAMVTPSYAPVVGGAEMQLSKVLPSLQLSGSRPTVYTRRAAGTSRRELVDGIPVVRCGITGKGPHATLAFLVDVICQLLRDRPQVIHSFQLMSPTSAAIVVKWILGVPVVAKVLRGGRDGDMQRIYAKPFGDLRMRWVCRNVDRFHVISDEISQELTRAGLDSDRIVRIPNGVENTEASLNTGRSQVSLKESLGVSLDSKVLLFCGRLVPEKNVDVLFAAFDLLQQKWPGSQLVIVGDGPERQTLEALAFEKPSVTILGMRSDVGELLAMADVFVLPSRSEGMSNALLEAMEQGASIVATNVGAARELLGDNERGWLVPPGDAEKLAEAIGDALSNDGSEKQRKASEHVRSSYSLEFVVSSLAAVYDQLTRRRIPQRGSAGVS